MIDPHNPLPDDDRTVTAPRGKGLVSETRGVSIGGQNALPRGTKLQEFEIEEAIGEGGFSIVYLAHDLTLQRRVAIKEYLPCALAARRSDMSVAPVSERYAETFAAGLASFIKEAHVLAHFDHASLVKVFRFWEANGTAYMAMPFYKGVTLKEALRNLGHLPDEVWLRAILDPVLDALEIIHADGYIHRDIAPDNILLLSGMRPVLLDFGAARKTITDMTQAITVILKPGYAPIEQYAEASSMQQGPWTDCYALASVMYLAITGKPPLPAVERIQTDSLVPLSQCAGGRYSEQFLRALDRAMAVKPDDRPRNVGELRDMLGAGQSPGRQESRPWKAHPPDAGERTWPKVVGIAAVLLVMAVAAAYYYADGFRKPSDNSKIAADKPVTGITDARPTDTPAANTAAVSPPIDIPAPRNPKAAGPNSSAPPAAKASSSTEIRAFQPTDVVDLLYGQRDPNWVVTAAPDNARVPSGAEFWITAQAPPGNYLHLFLLDGQSTLSLLYPRQGRTDNLVPPTGTVRLKFEQFGTSGLLDRYVVVVTAYPTKLDAMTWKPVDPFREMPLATLSALFGTAKWTPQLFIGTPICPTPRPPDCGGRYGASTFTIETIEGTIPAKR